MRYYEYQDDAYNQPEMGAGHHGRDHDRHRAHRLHQSLTKHLNKHMGHFEEHVSRSTPMKMSISIFLGVHR